MRTAPRACFLLACAACAALWAPPTPAAEAGAPLNSGPCHPSGDPKGGLTAATLMHSFLDFKAGEYQNEEGIRYAAVRDSDEWRVFQGLAGCLRTFDPAALGKREERLAFWINLYNGMVVHGVLAAGIPESVLDLPAFFDNTAYEVGGLRYSLEQIEHGILRGNLPKAEGAAAVLPEGDPRLEHALQELDPRIHFALVCGGRSCPPVRVYRPEQVEAQLDLVAREFLDRAVRKSPEGKGLRVPMVLRWFEEDFGGRDGVVAFLRERLSPGPARKALESDSPPKLSFVEFDWRLNNAP